MVSVAGTRADSAPTDKSPTGEPPTSDSPTGESPAGGSPAGDSPAGGTGGRADGSGAVYAQVRRLAGRYWFLLPIAVLVSSVLLAVQILDSRPEPAPVALVDCETERPDDYECWRDRLRTLVARDSPQAALADVRAVYDRVPFVADQCHQLVHEIGRAAGKRYGDVAEAYAVGDDLCASGYFHGVLEAVTEQIGLETLITEIDTVCGPLKERDPYSLDHYNCVHGLGHGLMGVTYSQLYESLAACDAYSEAWERESCYGGVFMENIMARDNPHHPSIYLRDDDPLYPCTEVDPGYQQQCYLMQTSHALRVVDFDYHQVFELCQRPEVAPHQATCLQSLGRDISGATHGQPEQTVDLCLLGGSDYTAEQCLIGAAKDYAYHFNGDTEALELCATVPDAALSQTCRDTVASFWAGR